MRIHPRFLNWGVFFLIAGAIPLAIQAGALDTGVVTGSWRLWPLFLVGAGLGIILRQTPIHLLGGLLVAVVFGVMVGSLIGVGGRFDLGSVACGEPGSGGTAFASQSGTLQDGAAVSLEVDCGDLNVTTANAGGWSIDGTTPDGQPPVVDASLARLAVRSRDFPARVPGLDVRRESWRVTVPATASDYAVTMNAGSTTLGLGGSAATNVSATVNAGSLTADLTGSRTRNLSVTVNAGSAKIDLPDASINGSLTVNAGSIAFCVPPTTALQLTTTDTLTGGYNYGARGLTKSGTTWTSSNWSTAANRIVLTTSANAGSFELDPQGGCK